MSNHDLISALTASSEREQAGVIAGALGDGERDLPSLRRRPAGAFAARAKQGCCGLSFTSHAKRLFCPLCGKLANAS